MAVGRLERTFSELPRCDRPGNEHEYRVIPWVYSSRPPTSRGLLRFYCVFCLNITEIENPQ